MRYLGNNTNLARTGALTATNALPSDAIYRTDTAAKVGGGLSVVTGPYTGAANTDIDVEIVDLAGTTPQVSAPAFSGVGNGTLSGLSAAGLSAQVITITLEDLGTQTRKAYAPFQGVTLRAVAAGTAGNLIRIAVDQSGLVRSATNFALMEDVTAGSNEYEGTHWDLSALGDMTLTADGKIPTTAPRIVFGSDPQVYMAYRKYKEGRYVYGFSPSPVRSARQGTRIFQVTGSRTLTISDGTDSNVLTGVVSLYDALVKMRDATDPLVAVDGPVVNDRLPGGQGVVDLSVWTSSYVTGMVADGSYSCLKADLTVIPTTTAPTETVRFQCIDASATGSELWRVDADVSGRLANAITNALYASGPVSTTIPLPEIPQSTPGNTAGNIEFRFEPVSREDSEMPSIKLFKPRLGASAKNGTYEFIYVERPDPLCDEEGQVSGGPREACLGINPPGDEIVSDESRLIRVQRVTAAVRLINVSNTLPPNIHAPNDIDWVNTSANILLDALGKIGGGTTVWDAWEANTAYPMDTIIEPTAKNGYRYAVQNYGGGTTHASTEPAWPTTVADTVVDNGVTWVCLGKTPYQMWDDLFDSWYDDALLLMGAASATTTPFPAWSEGVAEGSFSAFYSIVPTARNGCAYRTLGRSAYTSSGEPTWSTVLGSTTNETIDDGAPNVLPWECYDKYWTASSNVPEGKVINPHDGNLYRASVGGVCGSSEPTWAASVTDGAVTWTRLGNGLDVDPAAAEKFFLGRYTSAAQDVLASAGVMPNFDNAGVDGDGCWQDPGDNKYWQSTDGYLPVFNNVYWFSCRQFIDEDGEPFNQSTQEFGFGLQVGCIDKLVNGDKFSVTISGVVGSSTGQGYQEGDTFEVRIQSAVRTEFGGGQTGNDTLTWSVVLGSLGRLPDYALVTTALSAYSGTVAAWAAATAYADGVERRPVTRNGYRYSSSGGTSGASEPTWPTTLGATVVDNDITWTCSARDADIGFAITPGGIPFALGDKFIAEIEGGRFRWRRDGGAWSANIDIATTALADGLNVAFNGGIAPSWSAGDRWTYRAEATYGAVQARTPLDGELEWTGSTVIALAGGPINGIGFYRHRIPSDATITLTGSNDDFATSPLSVIIPWRRDNLWHGVVANYAKYRISINKSGAIRWLYAGQGTMLAIRTGDNEVGRLTKRARLASVITPSGLGASVAHEWLPASATDTLLAMLDHAGEFDDFLLGIVPNDNRAETGLVRFDSGSIDISDMRDYQPAAADADLRQSLTLSLTAE